jgi:predicted HTH transcriptional regulator
VTGKYRIFVSSVQKELAAERRAVRDFVEGDALLRRFFDVFLFEDLPASDRRADEVYLEEVDRCDIYVGLFGNQYGSEDSEGCSPTKREFIRAKAKGKARLIFVKGSDDRMRHPLMLALIHKAGAELIRRRFSSVTDLLAGIYASLVDHLERTGDIHFGPFDASACRKANLDDISKQKVSDFLVRARAERGYRLGLRSPLRATLKHLNLLDGDNPTNAAVLLFGKEPQRFLPTSLVKCLHFHGPEISKPIPSYQVFKGTLFEMVDQSVDFVLSKIDRSVGTRAHGPQAPVTYELPPQAVAEAVVNAVAHRDYASNASVQVMLFSDRLEIWNPGELPPPLSLQSLSEPHPSIPHNPLIAEPLFLTRYIERAGTGTLDMARLCAEAGLPAPEFREEQGQFIQVLRRPQRPALAKEVINSDKVLWERALSDVGRAFPGATAQVTAQVAAQVAIFCQRPRAAREIMDHLNLHHWKTFQANYLIPLIKDGLLERTIPDKPTSRLQKYRLTDKGRAWLAGERS